MYVFVYGTLRHGERNHQVIEGAPCIAEQAWLRGAMYAKGTAYPYITAGSDDYVYGELYQINATQLSNLDELEGYYGEGQENLYNRITMQVMTDTSEVTALVYERGSKLKGRTDKRITSGDWRVYQYIKQGNLLYFAYGSCMDDKRFKIQQVNHFFEEVIGRAVLDGYALKYSIVKEDGGRADIVEAGGHVEGKLYAIGREAIRYLYEREGVHTGSYRPAIIEVQLIDGTKCSALTFTVVEKEAEVAPPTHYIEEILRGGAECCSEEYLQFLKRHYQILASN